MSKAEEHAGMADNCSTQAGQLDADSRDHIRLSRHYEFLARKAAPWRFERDGNDT